MTAVRSEISRGSVDVPSRALTTRWRAFTLVELLVVIGIIALLISILLPSLSKARENANQLKCAVNLRSLYQATVMYGTENNGFMLPATLGGAQVDAKWWGLNALGRMYGLRGGTSAAEEASIREKVARMIDCPSTEKSPGVYNGDYVYNAWFGDIRAYPPVNTAYASYKYQKIVNLPPNMLVAMDINPDKSDNTEDRFYAAESGSSARLLDPSPTSEKLDRTLVLAGAPHGNRSGKHRKANMLFMSGEIILGEPQYIEDYMVRATIRGDRKKAMPW